MKKLLILLLVGALIAGGFLLLKKDRQTNRHQSTDTPQNQTSEQKLPLIDLQPTVDAWAAKQTGSASVVIIDLSNRQTVASLNPDKVFFSASIYKLYAAYLGYQKVADGTHKADEPYYGSYSRGKCLDEMIRSSHIPCGEKMAQELGSKYIMEKLKSYGLTGTEFAGAYATTTASDAAIILQRLYEKKDLNTAHAEIFLDSLKNQPEKYRIGLPSGFSKSTVFDKVGWNENLEWHDTAIVTLPNGRSFVVSVLTRSVGRANVVALAQAIEAELTK